MAVYIKDSDDFKSKVSEAGDKLVVVDFFAQWCGPCKMIAPKLEELAKEQASTIVVLKIDVDENEDLSLEYKITSMPTFLFLKDGKVVETFSGANYDKLRDTIARLQH